MKTAPGTTSQNGSNAQVSKLPHIRSLNLPPSNTTIHASIQTSRPINRRHDRKRKTQGEATERKCSVPDGTFPGSPAWDSSRLRWTAGVGSYTADAQTVTNAVRLPSRPGHNASSYRPHRIGILPDDQAEALKRVLLLSNARGDLPNAAEVDNPRMREPVQIRRDQLGRHQAQSAQRNRRVLCTRGAMSTGP